MDGKRAKASDRVAEGQIIRIPPLPKVEKRKKPDAAEISEKLVADLKKRILFKDDHLMVIDKPFGLAVQGGTGTKEHLDGALEHLKFGLVDKPRLVHRLDKDTAGVLLLARTAKAASQLAESFRRHRVRKYYWAVTVGRPTLWQGRIDAALLKRRGREFEKVEVDEEEGQEAVSYYSVIEAAGNAAAWVALWPVTGRTHQLRVHLASIGTPILGDPKYGIEAENLAGADLPDQLHLFAHRIIVPHPKGGVLDVRAPLPAHFKATWKYFNFDTKDDGDPFEKLRP